MTLSRVVDSEHILRSLGYTYHRYVYPRIEPRKTNLRFKDIAPELESNEEARWIANQYLYEHQLQALKYLEEGYNVVLRSGTGSGKTEAWFFYFFNKAKKEDFRAIAVYPTLALANDQIKRISNYARTAGLEVVKLDALQRDRLVKEIGIAGLKNLISRAKLIITNPAFLHHEVKKYLLNPSKALLHVFIRDLNLLVLDELDFYSPRSIALLLALVEFIVKFSNRNPQVVVLTATLANPEDMCRYLSEITKRPCISISGEPFSVENRVYIVLGKELDKVWSELRKYLPMLRNREDVDRDVLESLEDFEKFKKNAFRIVSYLEALGFEVPSLGLNPIEILSRYVEDDGVTLVFTKSIARAEELAKALREVVGDSVATHHHLVPKKLREEIEEKARRGEIKIVISPRTLTQGIDIGTVVRVVHIGLPEDVREFYQREGRKGRRAEIPFTESIVLPSTRWDWELLSKGFEALQKWLSLPLEKTLINPDNNYIKLFRGLAKILSPWYREQLEESELQVLKNAGVIKRDRSVDLRRAKWIWERLNFYEFGPPYGIKRYLETDTGLEVLEPIGHCDLVERFQVGCLDLSQDAIVTKLKYGRTSRVVTAVIEKPLKSFNFYENDALAEALEEYRYIKYLWSEEPSFLRDISRGKLHSYVLAVVYPPKQGFGELKKIPNRVIWYLISSKPRIVRIGNRHVVTYDRKTIYVPVNTAGEYRDFTYGIVIEVDEREDPALLRLGLAYLMIVLRRIFGIPFETIMYGIERIGEKKFFELHEPESCGLIEKLDWFEVRKAIEAYKPDDLDLVLLSQIDDIAYSDLLSLGLDLEIVKYSALRIVDYILMRSKAVAYLRGRRIGIPKPSRALKILSLDVLSHDIAEDEVIPKTIVALSLFDGEETSIAIELYTKYPFVPPPTNLRQLETRIEDLVYYEGFKLVVTDKEALAKELERAHLKRLHRLVQESAFSLTEKFKELGLEPISVTEFINAIELEGLEKPVLPDIVSLHMKLSEFIEKNKSRVSSLPLSLSEELRRFLEMRVRAIYIAYLVLEELLRER